MKALKDDSAADAEQGLLAHIAEWQASAQESLAIFAARERSVGREEDAAAITVAQGALQYAQSLVDQLRRQHRRVKLVSIEPLIDIIQSAGLSIDLEESGEPRPLRETVEFGLSAVLYAAFQASVSRGVSRTRVTVNFEWNDAEFSVVAATASSGPEPSEPLGPVLELVRHDVTRLGLDEHLDLGGARAAVARSGGVLNSWPVGDGIVLSARFPLPYAQPGDEVVAEALIR